MSPDPDKVSALNDASAPSYPTEVCSLLGMANYCLHFIPNYATITEPMRELMMKDTEWQWEKPQEDAFNLLKHSLREDTVTLRRQQRSSSCHSGRSRGDTSARHQRLKSCDQLCQPCQFSRGTRRLNERHSQ